MTGAAEHYCPFCGDYGRDDEHVVNCAATASIDEYLETERLMTALGLWVEPELTEVELQYARGEIDGDTYVGLKYG